MSWQHTCWPADKHAEILELIREAHGEYPDWAIAADLVHLADRANHPRKPEPFPGRRALAERYGVSGHKMREHLRAPGWQEKLDSLGIPRPERHLKGHGPNRNRPVERPSVDPLDTPSETNETEESTENRPVGRPSVDPSVATRVELDPPVPPDPPLSPTGRDQSAPTATLVLLPPPDPEPKKTKRARKPKSRASEEPETDWARQWTDVWSEAWNAARTNPYPWLWHRDRVLLLRAAGAVGAAPDEPMPPEARSRFFRAVGAYLDASSRGAAWPPGPATIPGFMQGIAGWVQIADGVTTTITGPPARAAPRAGFGHAGDGVLERLWEEVNGSNGVYDGE